MREYCIRSMNTGTYQISPRASSTPISIGRREETDRMGRLGGDGE